MNIRKIASAAVLSATLGLAGVTPAFAATSTTSTTLAPAAKAATPTTKGAVKGKSKQPVVAGNFCKQTLVGTTSKNAAGVALTCKADVKGQPRWTK